MKDGIKELDEEFLLVLRKHIYIYIDGFHLLDGQRRAKKLSTRRQNINLQAPNSHIPKVARAVTNSPQSVRLVSSQVY